MREDHVGCAYHLSDVKCTNIIIWQNLGRQISPPSFPLFAILKGKLQLEH